jgi:fructose-1-phosphate kinase PfkB-like protein
MGAFCYGLDQQLPLEETIRLSVGASAAMISTPGTQVPEFNRIHELVSLVELETMI